MKLPGQGSALAGMIVIGLGTLIVPLDRAVNIAFPDGRTYEGGFKDGHENGKGTITYPDGKIVEGEFRNGVMNGRGAKTWNAENTQRNKVRDQTSKLKG